MRTFPRLLGMLAAVSMLCSASGCYWMRGSGGGGQTRWMPPRLVRASDIAVPDG